MDYQASENDIRQTVQDFMAICEYIGANEPRHTACGDLPSKACFEINAGLSHPQKDAKLYSQMPQYDTISFLFQMLTDTALVDTKNNKGSVQLAGAYNTFKELNIYSKYIYIFLSWMRHMDMDMLYPRKYTFMHGATYADSVIYEIGSQEQSTWITRDPNSRFSFHEGILQGLMSAQHPFMCHLRALGVIEFNGDYDRQNTEYGISIGKMRLTPLGIGICKACETRRLTWVNKFENAKFHYYHDEDTPKFFENVSDFYANRPGSNGFFKPFEAIMPDGAIDIDGINALLFPDSGHAKDTTVFELKVELHGTVNIIQAKGTNTFSQLHKTILSAFGFEEGPLHSFFMNGVLGSRHKICDPKAGLPFSNKILLGKASLRVGQQIIYLFDFTEKWVFNITVSDIIENASPANYPIVIDSYKQAANSLRSMQGLTF